MGTVIEFPESLRLERLERRGSVASQVEPASIIILPVIRIERGAEEGTGGIEPSPGTTPGRRRRRRVSRS